MEEPNIENQIVSSIISRTVIKYSEPCYLIPAFKRLIEDYSRFVNKGYSKVDAALLSEITIKYSGQDHKRICNRLETIYKVINKFLKSKEEGSLEKTISELTKDIQNDKPLPGLASTIEFTF